MTHGVAAIGECMLELSGHTGSNWHMGFAGDTFNTLWTMRALGPGHHIDYVSAFGDDPFSQDQIEFFGKHDIGIAASPIVPGARPGLYAITLTGAERSFTYWRSDAAARQLASDPATLAKSLENRALVYFSGITLAILDDPSRKILLDAVTKARADGARIAFDPNYRPRLWPDIAAARDAIEKALAITDIALPTFPDEEALFGDASPETTAKRIERFDVPEVIVKNGELPALVSHYEKTEEIAPVHVSHPLDTTGAGDSFNGAYLSARLLGLPPADATRRAHRVAATVVQVRGALAPFELLKMAFDR